MDELSIAYFRRLRINDEQIRAFNNSVRGLVESWNVAYKIDKNFHRNVVNWLDRTEDYSVQWARFGYPNDFDLAKDAVDFLTRGKNE